MDRTSASYPALALAGVLVFALHGWEGATGFDVTDEGFLWYGVQRVIEGEVPLRDFMSYDPGRYYWSAWLMQLSGDKGLISLRRTLAAFQGIGLACGLLFIVRAAARQGFLYLLLSGLTLAAWMFPRHKLFDISLSILSIGVLAFLVQKPVARRYFISGLCIGVIAIFGRNHGAYGVIGSLGVMLWLSGQSTAGPRFGRGFAVWAAGVIAGYLPVLGMMLFIPGFATAFLESLRFLFERGSTNLSLPVPWPWLFSLSPGSGDGSRNMLVGIFFIFLILFGIASLSFVLWRKMKQEKVSPFLVASSFLALPYAHLAYARADVSHLAQGIQPMLIGSLVLLAGQPVRTRFLFAFLLCAASLWVTHIYHPGWQCHGNAGCRTVDIAGDKIAVDPVTAANIATFRQLAEEYAPDGQDFLAVPFWPGAYALLERKSPMWASYPLWPRSADFQLREIERIKASDPGFVLISEPAEDRLKFGYTNALVQQFIASHFLLLPERFHGYAVYIPKEVKF